MLRSSSGQVSGWRGQQVRAPCPWASVTCVNGGKTLEQAAEKEGNKQQDIWLDNGSGCYSLEQIYYREGSLEVMQEMLSCSWPEEVEIIGLISFRDTSVISAVHCWVLRFATAQAVTQRRQLGGTAASLGVVLPTRRQPAWQLHCMGCKSLFQELGFGKFFSNDYKKNNKIDSYLHGDVIYSSMRS